jgi:TolB-like protein
MGNSMGLMGRLLGLEVLVEGTIREVGGQIRITPKLVDVHTGRLIWADSYEYPAAEWDRIETGAAREVAAQVGAHLAIHGAFRNPGAR